MYQIDHVAIAVEDLDAAVGDFTGPAGTEHVFTKDSQEWGYRTAYMLAGEDMFTLIQPTSPGSFMADYIERRGPGIQVVLTLALIPPDGERLQPRFRGRKRSVRKRI